MRILSPRGSSKSDLCRTLVPREFKKKKETEKQEGWKEKSAQLPPQGISKRFESRQEEEPPLIITRLDKERTKEKGRGVNCTQREVIVWSL